MSEYFKKQISVIGLILLIGIFLAIGIMMQGCFLHSTLEQKDYNYLALRIVEKQIDKIKESGRCLPVEFKMVCEDAVHVRQRLTDQELTIADLIEILSSSRDRYVTTKNPEMELIIDHLILFVKDYLYVLGKDDTRLIGWTRDDALIIVDAFAYGLIEGSKYADQEAVWCSVVPISAWYYENNWIETLPDE